MNNMHIIYKNIYLESNSDPMCSITTTNSLLNDLALKEDMLGIQANDVNRNEQYAYHI